MPWTYLSLTQAITDWAENPEATFTANIPNMVRMAELRIAEQVQLATTRTLATGNLVQGAVAIFLPADYLAPYSLRLADRAGVYFFLKNKEDEFRRAAYPNPAYQSKPEYYSIAVGAIVPNGPFGPTIAFAPTPDWTYPYVFAYFGRPASIVDNSTTYIGTNAEDVLFFACMKNAAIFMKEEPDVVAMYDQMFAESVSNFKLTGQGRARKDWYRKPDKRIDPSAPQATQAGG